MNVRKVFSNIVNDPILIYLCGLIVALVTVKDTDRVTIPGDSRNQALRTLLSELQLRHLQYDPVITRR